MRSGTICRTVLTLLLGALLLVVPGMQQAPAVVHAAGGPRPAAAGDDGAYRSGELLIKFGPGMLAERHLARQLLGQVGASKTENLSVLGVERWQVPVGQEISLAKKLNALPGVEYAEPNYVVTAHLTPNDTYYSGYQWAHPVINSPSAWDLTTGSSAVIVAVIDTGVDLDNPEFQGRLVGGYDYANNDNNPDDDNGHGTHVAGIIAAMGNNQQGVAGMAWLTQIMPMKALNSSGSGFDSDTAEAVKDAVDAGADIINISLGGLDSSQTLYNAVRYAYDRDVLVVVSGGNCGPTFYVQNGCTYANQPVYPAAYDTEVFAVAATTELDTVAGFSNRNSYIDIAAPGVDIFSTYLDNGWAIADGTSQAAPHVTGLAALLLAIDPSLTSQEIQTHIEVASVDLGNTGWDPSYGAGRIDAYATLVRAIELTPPSLPAINNADRDQAYLIDWSDVTYAASYILEEDDTVSFSTPVTRYSGAISQAQIAGQSTGVWHYRVRAVRADAGLTSSWSNTSSVTVGLTAPTLNPINNAGSASYSVTWSVVDGATAYRLQESTSETFSNATTHDVGSSLSYNVVGQAGGLWYYRVQATLSTIASDWSATQVAAVFPEPPVLYTIVPNADPDAYTLTWSTSTGATGYRLQESTNTGFTDVITRYVGIDTSYEVTGQLGGTWAYRVEAANSAGFSTPSNSQSFTVTVPLIPTPILNPIPGPDSNETYTVSWSNVLTATGYTLEESYSPWFSAPTLAYTGALTQVDILNQEPGSWHYRVRALTPNGNSPWSAAESVAVPATTFLPIVMR